MKDVDIIILRQTRDNSFETVWLLPERSIKVPDDEIFMKTRHFLPSSSSTYGFFDGKCCWNTLEIWIVYNTINSWFFINLYKIIRKDERLFWKLRLLNGENSISSITERDSVHNCGVVENVFTKKLRRTLLM